MATIKQLLASYPTLLKPTDLVALGLFPSVRKLYMMRETNPSSVPKSISNLRHLLFSKAEVETFMTQAVTGVKPEKVQSFIKETITPSKIVIIKPAPQEQPTRRNKIQTYLSDEEYAQYNTALEKKIAADKTFNSTMFLRKIALDFLAGKLTYVTEK